MKKRLNWANIYLIFMFVFLYLPIFYLAFYSFNSGDTMTSFEGFSLQWYQELFKDKEMLNIILNTFFVALVSAMISTLIGIVGALTIYSIKSKRLKMLVESVNTILIVSPDVIIGISFLLLFTLIGLKLGLVTVLIAHIAFNVPVVVIMILPRLQTMNKNLINAASDLGANSRVILSQIILPTIFPGILAGFLTAFTYSLDDFVVTFFVTGNGFTTLSVNIYTTARQGISLEINALSTIIFLITFTLALVYYFINMKMLSSGGKR